MKAQSTIDGLFKRKRSSEETTSMEENTATSTVLVIDNSKEVNDIDLSTLERDPGLRPQIYDYPDDQQDTIRRSYMKLGPLQPTLPLFPKSGCESHKRSFQPSWFKLYHWLEYSESLDAAFCFPCFLFNKPFGPGSYGQQAFRKDGFRNWKKVGGKKCVFLQHMGSDCTSFHNVAQRKWDDLLTEEHEVHKVREEFLAEEREKEMRLMASTYSVRWCAFQGLAFRGHDENKGNFLEMLDAIGYFNEEVGELLRDASKCESYTSPMIQKEILNFILSKVRRMISEEIGGGKFCLLVDEVQDESHKDHVSIVLRFVNKEGLVIERLFGLVQVPNMTSQTLRNEIYSLLSCYNLDVKSIRGQGYDGASNIRDEFQGLQVFILNDCQYAYFVHCVAHRLQLALITASQGVIALRKFFTRLTFVVNVVCASSKRTDRPRNAQADQIAFLVSIEELETNHIGTSDTRCSSHLKSVSNLIKMFSSTCEVLLNIIEEEDTGPIQGDADLAYEAITKFEFIFILHLEKEIMEITDLLCQTLQRQDQDIYNALRLVASTKVLLQKMKDERWDGLLHLVKSFCEVHKINIPDLSSSYISRGARKEQSDQTLEHHYRVDIFYEAIDCLLKELDHRFNDSSMELLHLSLTLDPKNAYEAFRSDDVCQLVDKFYPEDFSDHERTILKMQLLHYEIDAVQHAEYKQLASISELCQWLVRTKRAVTFDLIYRVVSLILTLPISTPIIERSFSAINSLKTRLQNKAEDEVLNDSLVLYIEREIAEKISLEEIVQDFRATKERRLVIS